MFPVHDDQVGEEDDADDRSVAADLEEECDKHQDVDGGSNRMQVSASTGVGGSIGSHGLSAKAKGKRRAVIQDDEEVEDEDEDAAMVLDEDVDNSIGKHT